MNRPKTDCQRREKASPTRPKPHVKTAGRVMATITSASLSSTPRSREGDNPLAEIRAFWRRFFARAFNPYRPELHYMRGPGPAWRAKHVSAAHLHST